MSPRTFSQSQNPTHLLCLGRRPSRVSALIPRSALNCLASALKHFCCFQGPTCSPDILLLPPMPSTSLKNNLIQSQNSEPWEDQCGLQHQAEPRLLSFRFLSGSRGRSLSEVIATFHHSRPRPSLRPWLCPWHFSLGILLYSVLRVKDLGVGRGCPFLVQSPRTTLGFKQC